jgi:hypothetical protein
VKQNHGTCRCWLKGQTGDARRAPVRAAGCNLRWLLREIKRLDVKPRFFALMALFSRIRIALNLAK